MQGAPFVAGLLQVRTTPTKCQLGGVFLVCVLDLKAARTCVKPIVVIYLPFMLAKAVSTVQ